MNNTSFVPDVSTWVCVCLCVLLYMRVCMLLCVCACAIVWIVCVCMRLCVCAYVCVGRHEWDLHLGEATAIPQGFAHLCIWVLNVVPHPAPLRRYRLCIIDDLHLQRCVLYRCKCYYSFYILCSCWKIILSLNNMAVQFFFFWRGGGYL